MKRWTMKLMFVYRLSKRMDINDAGVRDGLSETMDNEAVAEHSTREWQLKRVHYHTTGL